MRVLLDENVPHKLKHRLGPEHDVTTVVEHGWGSKRNGELLRAADAEFDALVTMDRGIQHQQSLAGLRLRVVVLRSRSNEYTALLPLVSELKRALEAAEPGRPTFVGAGLIP
jgi:predicted nuclease of predicted toxin-antitoxin system